MEEPRQQEKDEQLAMKSSKISENKQYAHNVRDPPLFITAMIIIRFAWDALIERSRSLKAPDPELRVHVRLYPRTPIVTRRRGI